MKSNVEIKSNTELLTYIMGELDRLVVVPCADPVFAPKELEFKSKLLIHRNDLHECLRSNSDGSSQVNKLKVDLFSASTSLTVSVTEGSRYLFTLKTVSKTSPLISSLSDLNQKIGESQLAILTAQRQGEDRKLELEKQEKEKKKELEKQEKKEIKEREKKEKERRKLQEKMQEKQDQEERDKRNQEIEQRRQALMSEQMQQVNLKIEENNHKLTQMSTLLDTRDQQLALVSNRYDDSREKLSLVRQEKDEAKNLIIKINSIIKELPKEEQGKLREVFAAPSSNGTAFRFVYEDKTKSAIDPKKEHKYWTQSVPKPEEYNQKRSTVSDQSVAVTKQLMSYAMTPRRAVAATILYRYLLKFNNALPSKHADLYQKDASEGKQKNLDINRIISAAILFLFLEVDSKWPDALSQMKVLDSVAKNHALTKLQAKIAKIDGRDADFDPYEFDDALDIRDQGKKPLEYAGKYAFIMWKRDPFFTERPFVKEFADYCDRLYIREKKPNPEPSFFLGEHDRDLLNKLYVGK